MNKGFKVIVAICMLFLMMYNDAEVVKASENIFISTNEMEGDVGDMTYVGTYEMENGITCVVYEFNSADSRTSTIYGGTQFQLYYAGNYMGYLLQKTTWVCNGSDKPMFVNASNTFYSTNASTIYMEQVNAYTAICDTTSRKYVMTADVYYNSVYIATTEFTTICTQDGICSYIARDL